MKKYIALFFFILSLSSDLISQSLTSVLLPQYIQGNTGTNSNRIPFAYRARLTGLTPNAVYRYYNQVIISTDLTTQSGAGNCIFKSVTGNFIRTTGPGLKNAGTYDSLTTDGTGAYEGWFITEPTGNARFLPGKYVFMRITLNDGAGGTSAVTRITTADSVRVVKLDPASSDSTATGLRCTSSGSPKDFVFTYDNTTGTGRPISGSFIESDGTANTTGNSYASFYSVSVDGVNGAFGVVLPNILPNGIQRIERRSLATGAIIDTAKDNNGIWPSGANTVNPTGGITEIVLAGTDLLTYSLFVTSSHGTVTKVPDEQNYQYGTSVQLTATPDSAYHFVTWGGDVPLGHETDNPLTITMNQNRTITAFFALNTFSPTLILPTDSNITSTTAILGAKVVSNGNDSITERGVVWSTSSNPTTTNHKVIASDTNEIYKVKVDSLPPGTLIYFRGYAINNIGTGYSPQDSFYTLYREPVTTAGSFSAKAVLAHQINLSWDTATGASGYIILQRTNTDPTAVPKDANSYAVGDSIGDGLVVGLISLSAKTTISITGLAALTTYHFSIIPFAWDGLHVSTYNYKTDTVPTANAKTLKQAEFISVLLPQYIQGNIKPNSDRIPFAYRGRLTGLLENATYRFLNQVVLSTDPDSADGAGNCIFISMTGNFVLTSAPSIESPGSYGILKTDSSGTYEGWFITEPTGNYRFVPGKYIFMRIQLNDGMSGTIVATHLTMMDSVRIVKLNPSISDSTGTGLRCTSAANPKDFVFVYDTKAGTGRPISGSFIENDGTANTIENNYAAFYANHVDGIDGSFGVVLPNNLPNGVRRVERRSLTTGAIVVFATDDNGIWPSGVNTVNPSGGTTELVLAGTDVRWTTSVQNTSMIPDKYLLSQNYPNPFNPTTIIKYQLPVVSKLSLKVYDVLGREITTLVDAVMNAGYYSVSFDGADFASGIYFARITATPQNGTAPFTNTIKMLITK